MIIEFEMTHEGTVFRDAIVLPDGYGMTDEQIDQIKQKRFADWLEATKPAEEE